MGRKIRKHIKNIYPIKKPPAKENLHAQNGDVSLNIAQTDRISFSVLRDEKNRIRKIENISYEISIKDHWKWIVRYDDHGGKGSLHRHTRISLQDEKNIESTGGIRKYRNKDHELTWVCNEIKRNHQVFRSKFLKNTGLDLY